MVVLVRRSETGEFNFQCHAACLPVAMLWYLLALICFAPCQSTHEVESILLATAKLQPKWQVTFQVNESTIIMACNYSGYFSKDVVTKLARFAIVDIDWSNANVIWVNEKPMTCQESLLIQAKAIKAVNNKTKVWVYRLSKTDIYRNKKNKKHL